MEDERLQKRVISSGFATWRNFTNNFISYCELFFFAKHPFFQNSSSAKLLFYAPIKERREVKLKKVVFHSSPPYFLLIAMYEAVGKIILPNICSKTAQLHQESYA